MTATLEAFRRRAADGVVTVHVRDHYVVQPTPSGEALPLFTREATAIQFATEAIRRAPTELRLAVVTWPPTALPDILEHARRAGWHIGADWEVVAGGELAGPVAHPREVLAELADAGADTPSPRAPIDTGHQPDRAQAVRLTEDGTVIVRDLPLEG